MTKKIFSNLTFGLAICIIMSISQTQVSAQQKSSTKVVVVGAGISGLLASVYLEEKGVDVILLEKEAQVGGRVYSEPLGGTYANLGAQYYYKSDNDYLNLYIKKAEKFISKSGKQGVLWDGQFISSKGSSFFLRLPLDKQVLKDVRQSIKKMQAVVKEINKDREYFPDKNPISQAWLDLDKISAEQYLSEFHPDLVTLYNMLLIPEGGAGADETSALLFTGWFGHKGGGASYLIKGGNQKIPEAMAYDIKNLGGTIHLSTEVSDIINIDNGVEVKCSNGTTYSADYVIVTTPATVTKWIVKDLPAEKLEALNAVTYGASMQVGLHLKNIPADKRISASIFHNENINAYLDQSSKAKGNETVISLNIAGSEVHSLTDAELIAYVTEPLKKIYPDFSAEKNIADYSIKKWKDGIVRYPPNFLSNYQEAIRAPVGRIIFGGDYTHSPALDGAAWSGKRAANQVLEMLKK